MKISVVIPCYNAGKWIFESLDSIYNQTITPYEIIVVDDGSTDNSINVVKKYSSDILVIKTKHLNAAGARNVGIKSAKGEWIAFLDADDIWYPHHLEDAVKLLKGTSDVAYLGHNDQWKFNDDGSTFVVDRSTDPPFNEATTGIPDWGFFEWYARKYWFCTCSLIAEKQRLLDIGGFDESLIRRHDYELFLRLIHNRTWTYNPKACMAYRFLINSNSVASNHFETNYYLLIGLIKSEPMYQSEIMDQLIQTWSIKMVKKVARYPLHPLAKKANKIALQRLNGINKFTWGNFSKLMSCFI